jgi:hypothetical protein
MELIFAHQVGFNHLKDREFNYFIAASGYEDRCTYLMDNVNINAPNKIVLAFDDKKDFLFRKKNDTRFNDEGFAFIEESGRNNTKILELLEGIFNNGLESLSILIDYSCMSKIWYSAILQYLISNESSISNLEVYFSYTSAIFSEPLESPRTPVFSSPVSLLKSSIDTSKPLALIIGLGYEEYLTRDFLDKLEYDILYAFYSDPAFDSRYVDRVIKNNQKILRRLPPECIYKYPIEDFRATDALLTNLSIRLRLNFRVSILPVGPKPFTLSSLLLAARYPDIEVWSIDQGHASTSYSRNPAGEPVVCKVLFSNDEESYL